MTVSPDCRLGSVSGTCMQAHYHEAVWEEFTGYGGGMQGEPGNNSADLRGCLQWEQSVLPTARLFALPILEARVTQCQTR